VRYLALVLAAACAVTAGPAFAETSALLRKPQPLVSTRIAQYACLEGEHKCCCDRAGPLCCEGYSCVVRNNVGYCRPNQNDDE
jgi:hypothetical protein